MSPTTTSPGLLLARQVDLRDVARDDHLRAEPEPGEEHLHLLGRGVLRLVEDDEGVVERAAAHERERRDLDHPALEVRGDLLRLHHVVQRVEQRAQVGVDLRHQVAGQEAEPLAGLDRGAREDDPVDLAARERGGRHRHGEERLAGARRADAERDRGAADRVDVPLLVDRLRRDLEVAVAPDDVVEHLARATRPGRARARPTRSSRRRCRGRGRPARTARARPFAALCTASASPSSVTTLPRRKIVRAEVLLQRLEDRVLGAGQLGRHLVGELQLPSCHLAECFLHLSPIPACRRRGRRPPPSRA